MKQQYHMLYSKLCLPRDSRDIILRGEFLPLSFNVCTLLLSSYKKLQYLFGQRFWEPIHVPHFGSLSFSTWCRFGEKVIITPFRIDLDSSDKIRASRV